MSFREDFKWGAATASYQIEGAAYEDGRGLSIWDVFCRDGKTFKGHNGDTACDHYHRYKGDVALMKKIGLKAYRFSVAWPRVIPNGTGMVNRKGLKFYISLLDKLNAAGIEPHITLYHWDLPYELQKKGGWLNRDIVKAYADYVRVVVKAFGDRAKNYITFNEPQCAVVLGYRFGEHAPGWKLSKNETWIAAHNMLLAHGEAVKIIREHSAAKVGFAPLSDLHYPATDSAADLEAAKRTYFGYVPEERDSFFNMAFFSDPVYFGEYPGFAYDNFGDSPVKQGDFEIITRPTDYHYQNVYSGAPVSAADNERGFEFADRKVGYTKTAFNWAVEPKALYYGPKFIAERYKKPIFISENGMSCHDVVSLDGKVHDPNRIDFLARYIGELKKASADGVDLRGYFLWSLMDNFEWAHGYNERFGIIYIDFETKERVLKDSAYWYSKVIKTNGDIL